MIRVTRVIRVIRVTATLTVVVHCQGHCIGKDGHEKEIIEHWIEDQPTNPEL